MKISRHSSRSNLANLATHRLSTEKGRSVTGGRDGMIRTYKILCYKDADGVTNCVRYQSR